MLDIAEGSESKFIFQHENENVTPVVKCVEQLFFVPLKGGRCGRGDVSGTRDVSITL